jgi:hypothetical protein
VSVSAVLLVGPSEAPAAGRLERILAFFGVESGRLTVAEFLSSEGDAKVHVLCTADSFLELLAAPGGGPERRAAWQDKAHSAFVIPAENPTELQEVARQVTDDPTASLIRDCRGGEWAVSAQLPGFCRSMSGIGVPAANGGEAGFVFDPSTSGVTRVISSANGAAFVKVGFRGVPVFLSAAGVLDVDAPLAGRVFDVRGNFLSAVPVVLYVTWAFAETCWRAAETPACLVVDDPLLRPRYGHLNFERFLRLMKRLDSAASIAFIPWNWKRSRSETVRLLRESRERLSLSIHGCDHTGGEFGSRDRDRLLWKTERALERMARHERRTGLPYDRVMVFPQGVFSEEAMEALKRCGLVAAVNSEVISADDRPNGINVCDYWDVAVMSYSDFPIFTRRHPSEGLENFAFDILLGKPCLVVAHQGDFHDECRQLEGFIARLNALNAQLSWTTLGSAVRRSVRRRRTLPHAMDVEIYGSEACLHNPFDEAVTARITKRESACESIEDIRIGGEPVRWTSTGDRVSFEAALSPGETRAATITYKRLKAAGVSTEALHERVKVAARRRLCELRDNYLRPRSIW